MTLGPVEEGEEEAEVVTGEVVMPQALEGVKP